MNHHILSVLVEDRPGVLTRVTGLFSRRGFNIESLAVGSCEQEEISRITIVVSGVDIQIEQMIKQLHKLIEIIKVQDITNREHVERELALIRVKADHREDRSEIIQVAGIFRAKIVDISTDSLMIEMSGDSGKVIAIQDLLKPYGILEMVRTGKIALKRGTATIFTE